MLQHADHGHIESITRVPLNMAHQADYVCTVDLLEICTVDSRTTQVYVETKCRVDSGLAVNCQPSSRSAWSKAIRRQLRAGDAVDHSAQSKMKWLILPSKPSMPSRSVRFHSAGIHFVEQLEKHEIVGEWREPNGENPSWYHIAQCRQQRKRQLEDKQVESVISCWRERARTYTYHFHQSDSEHDDSDQSFSDEDNYMSVFDSDDELDLYISFEDLPAEIRS